MLIPNTFNLSDEFIWVKLEENYFNAFGTNRIISDKRIRERCVFLMRVNNMDILSAKAKHSTFYWEKILKLEMKF